MLPYSNRIRGGRFTFGGRTHQLSSAGNHAIHGDVRRRPWEVVERGADRLRLRFDSATVPDFNWPWPIEAVVEIRLEGDALMQTLSVWNRGTEAMPAGFGWHPYYRRWLSRDGEPVELGFTATAVHPDPDADGLPDGPPLPLPADLVFDPPRPLGDRRLDTCFAGFAGRATIAWPESRVRLRYECSPNVTHLVCFTPADRPVIAIEPVANANDGVNLLAAGQRDHGVIVVAPGERLDATFCTLVETD
jgi:aldose 1-epimerase